MTLKTLLIKKIVSMRNVFNAFELDSMLNDLDSAMCRMQVLFKYMDQDLAIDVFLSRYIRKVLCDLEYVVLTTDTQHNYFIYRKTIDSAEYLWTLHTADLKEAYKQTATENDIISKGYISIKQIKFPTGKLIFTDIFRNNSGYIYKLPDALGYTQKYSLNSDYGCQNRMEYYSNRFNVGFVQLDNTLCSVYKVDSNKLVLASCKFNAYNSDKYKLIGSFDCVVWRSEFMDAKFHRLCPYDNTVEVTVSPGIWTIKNYYKFIEGSDKHPWVVLNKIE